MKLLTCIAVLGATIAVASAATPSPDFSIPQGYRDWTLISVAAVGSPVNDIRAKLGNDVAAGAAKAGTIPYPDGSIIVRLAWKQVSSMESNDAFRLAAHAKGISPEMLQKFLSGTFVAGPGTNLQFMIKDSAKYASTGGWGFLQFTDGKLDTTPAATTCFACHAPAKATDFVFTRYAP